MRTLHERFKFPLYQISCAEKSLPPFPFLCFLHLSQSLTLINFLFLSLGNKEHLFAFYIICNFKELYSVYASRPAKSWSTATNCIYIYTMNSSHAWEEKMGSPVGYDYFLIIEKVSLCCHWSNSRLQDTKNELINININLPIRFKCSLIEGARTPLQIVPAHFHPWLKFMISFSGVHFSSCWGNQLQTKTAASQGLWSWHQGKAYGVTVDVTAQHVHFTMEKMIENLNVNADRLKPYQL